MDAHRAETGNELTIDALQKRIGGSRERIATFRDEHLAARLLDAVAPSGGPVRNALEKAASAALKALSVEATRVADHVAREAHRMADERIAAGQRLQEQARQAEAQAQLERENAIGRGDALGLEINRLAGELTTRDQELTVAQEALGKRSTLPMLLTADETTIV